MTGWDGPLPQATRSKGACINRRVDEKFLHRVDVVAGLQQMGGKAMAQRMRCRWLGDPSLTHRVFHRPLEHILIRMVTPHHAGARIDRPLAGNCQPHSRPPVWRLNGSAAFEFLSLAAKLGIQQAPPPQLGRCRDTRRLPASALHLKYRLSWLPHHYARGLGSNDSWVVKDAGSIAMVRKQFFEPSEHE